MEPEKKLVVSINEAAHMLSLSHWTIRKYINEGMLPYVRIGRRVLLNRSELERLVKEGTNPIKEMS